MNEIEREIAKEKFLVEYNNRVRIFEDSQRICNETNNFDVLVRRAKEVRSFIEWTFEMQKLRLLKVTTHANLTDAIMDYHQFYNENCLRLTKTITGRKRIETLKEIDKSLFPASNFREVAEYIANEIKKNELE